MLSWTPSDSRIWVPAGEQLAGSRVRTGAEAREGLFQQIPNSVLWSQSVRYLADSGVSRFIEVGPGAVLTGLLRDIRLFIERLEVR